MKPFVSVILISYNSEKDIEECIKSLNKQTYKNFNIILVDNYSKDKSVEIARKFKEVKIIENKENKGFAEGNNIGIRKAFEKKETKYVVCLNLDTIVDKNWLKELVDIAERNKKIGSVQSKILFYDKKNKINTDGNNINYLGVGFCGNYFKKDSKENKVKEITYASAASAMYSRKALEEIGLFDESLFMYHEDLDLGWRLRLLGYKNILSPKSIVYHKYNFSKKGYKFYYLERNRHIVNLKNYKIKSLLLFLPIGVIFEIGMIFYSIFAGFFFRKIGSYFGFFRQLPKTLKKRKEIQKTRKVSDKEITKMFNSEIEFEDVNNPILNKVANPLLKVYWNMVRGFI